MNTCATRIDTVRVFAEQTRRQGPRPSGGIRVENDSFRKWPTSEETGVCRVHGTGLIIIDSRYRYEINRNKMKGG